MAFIPSTRLELFFPDWLSRCHYNWSWMSMKSLIIMHFTSNKKLSVILNKILNHSWINHSLSFFQTSSLKISRMSVSKLFTISLLTFALRPNKNVAIAATEEMKKHFSTTIYVAYIELNKNNLLETTGNTSTFWCHYDQT